MTGKWMELDIIILNEINQTWEDKHVPPKAESKFLKKQKGGILQGLEKKRNGSGGSVSKSTMIHKIEKNLKIERFTFQKE